MIRKNHCSSGFNRTVESHRQQTPPSTCSFATETFSSATVTITLKQPIVVSTTPADYFLTYDISQFAAEGNGLGVALLDPTHFTVQVPNTVFVGTAPIASPTFVIGPTVNQVTVTFDQISGNTAKQNDKNVAMLRMNMKTDRNTALVQKIRFSRTGSAGSLDSDRVSGCSAAIDMKVAP